MEEYLSSSIRKMAKDINLFINKKSIILGLNFEVKTGIYFEVTSKYHSIPGELSCHIGFRILELHNLWFDFITSWWKGAMVDQKSGIQK